MYDINTAKIVGGDCNDDIGLHRSLYRKRNGEYFLHTTSDYSDDKIQPLSLDQAKDWVFAYLAEEYDNIFGDEE